MSKRSFTNKQADGHKATEYKVAQYGPGELSRAAAQAIWTQNNPRRPKSENPYLREKVYTKPRLEKAKKFREYNKKHRDQPHSENPYKWLVGEV